MKNTLISLAVALALVVASLPASASAQMNVPQGGTGTTTVPLGRILFGQGSSLPGSLRLGGDSDFSYSTSTDTLNLANLTITGTCTGCSGFAWPFTVSNPNGQAGVSTSTLVRFLGGASSTAFSANTLAVGQTATTTIGSDGALTISGDLTVNGGTWNSGGIDLASGDDFEINGTNVLTATGLGSGVLSSSLTSLGTIANFVATNATSSNLYVLNLTSALALFDSNGQATEYAGIDCTNQFVRDVSAAGAGTCATVGAADVSLANLSATDTTLTFSGTYNGSTARTIGLNLGNANTWTALQTFGAASTTHQSVATWLGIPNGTDPTVTSSGIGTIAINETAASSSIRFDDGTAERALFDEEPVTLTFIKPAGVTGTTTTLHAGSKRQTTYTYAGCSSTGGTANVQLGDGSASTTMIACVASPAATTFTTLSSNNTFNFGEIRFIDWGTFSASGTTTVSFTLGKRYNAD